MSGRLLGVLAITLTAILWGTTGTAATFAPSAGPLAIGAAALGIGGLLQAAIAVPALRRSRAALSRHRGMVGTGAVAVAVYPLAFYSSMHLAGVAIGSVVSLASAPIASGVLDKFVSGRRLGARWMVAASMGAIGGVLLSAAGVSGTGEDGGTAGDASSTVAGVLLGLVAGLTYAAYSWVAQTLMSDGVERGAAMGAVFGWGGALLVPVLLVTGAPLIASAQAFSVAAYMAIVPMFLGYVLFGYGLARVPASTATTITLIEPAVAAVLAVVIVGERLSPLGWAGLAIIAAVPVLLSAGSDDDEDRVVDD